MTETGEPPPPNDWQKQQWKEAERAFDASDKAIEAHFRQIEAFAVLGLRTLALTAAGGIAGALGFYSANYGRLSGDAAALDAFNRILITLFLALLCSLVATLCAYLSQTFFVGSISNRERQYEHPYVLETPKSERIATHGSLLRFASIVVSVLGVVFLVVAGGSFTTLL